MLLNKSGGLKIDFCHMKLIEGTNQRKGLPNPILTNILTHSKF